MTRLNLFEVPRLFLFPFVDNLRKRNFKVNAALLLNTSWTRWGLVVNSTTGSKPMQFTGPRKTLLSIGRL
jgi:hypothetical protein